jgi:hypothetical protein
MDTIDGHFAFAVALGFMAGFVITAFCARWLGLFLAALIGAVRKPAESIGARIRLFGQPAVLLLLPGAWILLGIIPFFAYRFIWVHPTHESRAFFRSLLLSVAVQVVAVTVVIRRARRKVANRVPS